MNECKITVLCSICKEPTDIDKAVCSNCISAISQYSLPYEARHAEIIAHAKFIIRMAHEMVGYDSILLKDYGPITQTKAISLKLMGKQYHH